jgi:hypothetical protein
MFDWCSDVYGLLKTVVVFVVMVAAVAADRSCEEQQRMNARSDGLCFEKNVLLANLYFVAYRFLLLCNSYFT